MVYVLHNGLKSFLKEFYLFHAHVFSRDIFETSVTLDLRKYLLVLQVDHFGGANTSANQELLY